MSHCRPCCFCIMKHVDLNCCEFTLICYFSINFSIISNTKFNSVSYVGLSWSSVLIFVYYNHLFLQILDAYCQSLQQVDFQCLVTFHPLAPCAVKSLKLTFEANSGIRQCAEIRYFPFTITTPEQWSIKTIIIQIFYIMFLLVNHKGSFLNLAIFVVNLWQHVCCYGCYYVRLEGNPAVR
jgi:hypothetical protein